MSRLACSPYTMQMNIAPPAAYWSHLFSLLKLDLQRDGLQIIGRWVSYIDSVRPALVCKWDEGFSSDRLSVYPSEHPARLAIGGQPTEVLEGPLSELRKRLDSLDTREPWALYLPPLSAAEQGVGGFDGLRAIVARLRGRGGCPWDREQTHQSLKAPLLEEAYEVLEALDSGRSDKLCEELGDLLMQVMIHTQIAEEAGEFDMGQVVGGISQKLIRRHPHVFGDTEARTAQEVMVNWEAIKRTERPHGSSSLGNLPKQMPALSYAQSVQQRVARQGFDWQNIQGVIDKVAEEVREVVESESIEEKLHEMGDLLFALVNLSRWLGLDSEECLRLANQRFIRRFSFIEEICRERGCQIKDLSFDEQDALWEMAKERTR
ncbi:MAG: nucleoside triphosphate pyrophosphohydrolase [Dehalococcoidia bacterium]|nr:nucleoside triphosphate pyrophosphohydrolase [Dehalococcoidia bacterium]